MPKDQAICIKYECLIHYINLVEDSERLHELVDKLGKKPPEHVAFLYPSDEEYLAQLAANLESEAESVEHLATVASKTCVQKDFGEDFAKDLMDVFRGERGTDILKTPELMRGQLHAQIDSLLQLISNEARIRYIKECK